MSTNVSAMGDFFYAFVVLAIIGAPAWWFLAVIPVLILSGILYTAVCVTFSSISFYIKKGEAVANVVEGAFMQSANYPPAIFNTVVKGILFTIVPVFFFTFIPAQYIFLTFNIWWLLGYAGVVALWVVIAFVVFHLGLKRYNSGNLTGGRL